MYIERRLTYYTYSLFGFTLFGSPLCRSMDPLNGDPNKVNPKSENVYIHIHFSGSLYLDLLCVDPWIPRMEIQIIRTQNRLCLFGSPLSRSKDPLNGDPWIYSKEIQIHRTQNRFCLFRSPLSRSMDPLSGDPWNTLMKIQINRTLNRFFLLGSPLSRSLDPLIGDPRIP